MSSRQLSKEEEEYLTFRFMLIKGDLSILKHELIHVLYKMFVRLLRSLIAKSETKKDSNMKIKADIEIVLSYKRDFMEITNYAEEIDYVDPVIRELPSIEVLKKDIKLAKIFTSSKRLILS